MNTSEFVSRFCAKGRYSDVAQRVEARFSEPDSLPEFQLAAGLDDTDPSLLSLVEMASVCEYPLEVFASWVKALGPVAAYWNWNVVGDYISAGVSPSYVQAIGTPAQTQHALVIESWNAGVAPEYVL